MNAVVQSKKSQSITTVPVLEMSEQELISVLENSIYPGASRESIKMAISYCAAAKLDPLQKPVHIVPMWDTKAKRMRDVIMPGIGLYRTQAARSGEYAGVSEPEFGEDVTENIGGVTVTYPKWCKATVKRRLPSGEIVEFSAKEFWKENYAVKGGQEKSIAPNAMWAKRPYGQLAKCAEAQALRKAFPELGAQPTAEEMQGSTIETSEVIDGQTGEIIQVQKSPARPALEPYSLEHFEQNFPKWKDLVESGKRSAEDILAMIRSKATLTEEQEAAIRALGETANDFAEIAEG
ncbi:phage recombination protein Bet [Acidithiobacillus caldus]|uniref:phage recombination protein Bet n=1 Tax=Acidithiobacillus caldus TaxID=33059 RepID=UPI001C06F0DC|nr:phage recombination protein Bet [Acidithiobacillus caldus]MBU2763707.1 phage recombination protein Bet [Acidithiobacillus caldus]MBU2771882.1 phage recombination protein Bet [Acidithiobacillus caldus]WMT47968.1 MAG: phage recombination protein Bet [Acidithiobacillus caldus]